MIILYVQEVWQLELASFMLLHKNKQKLTSQFKSEKFQQQCRNVSQKAQKTTTENKVKCDMTNMNILMKET